MRRFILVVRNVTISAGRCRQKPVNVLFFASGPDEESHGLYGRLDVYTGP
ncbi:MAG TPA: hypothetical protein VHF02_05855 [Luteimonas sp.]|nr:hypothetical protein [Luteimonas sp.]